MPAVVLLSRALYKLYKLEREHKHTLIKLHLNKFTQRWRCTDCCCLLLKALIMLFNGLVAILLDLKYTVI